MRLIIYILIFIILILLHIIRELKRDLKYKEHDYILLKHNLDVIYKKYLSELK